MATLGQFQGAAERLARQILRSKCVRASFLGIHFDRWATKQELILAATILVALEEPDALQALQEVGGL